MDTRDSPRRGSNPSAGPGDSFQPILPLESKLLQLPLLPDPTRGDESPGQADKATLRSPTGMIRSVWVE